jgi:hypothetical protein
MTLFGIIFFLYLLIHDRVITLDLFNSLFLIAAIGGCLCLYADIFLKGYKWLVYCLVLISFLLFFSISNLFLNFNFVILLLWLLGGIHIILHILLEPKNRTETMIMNGCVYISLPLFIIISNSFLKLSGLNHPMVQDEFLMAIDGTLGIYPSLIMGRFFQELPAEISYLCMCFYLILPAAIILIYIKRSSSVKEPPYSFMIEIILTGLLGYALYNVIPACGGPAFNTWPNSLPQQFSQTNPQWIYSPAYLPRNNLPSLHTAWLICLLRQAWLCEKNIKIMVSIFAFANLIAMFAVGHYLIDLIVGFAFANCIGGLCAFQLKWQNSARMRAILFGGVLCLSWYLVILYCISLLQLSKGLAWSLYLASLYLSLYLEIKLFKGSKSLYNNYSTEPSGIIESLRFRKQFFK